MNAKKLDSLPSVAPLSLPVLTRMPTGEGDFLPELHRRRMAGEMTSHFGEVMSKKTSNTADARQKRGS